MPSSLFDRLRRILPLAKQVADDNVSEEKEILKELIPQMFEVMYRVAKLSCDYVKRGRWSSPRLEKSVLIIAARTTGDPPYPEIIGEIDKALIELIEYFDRVMSSEALRLANEMGKLSFFQAVDS